MTPIERLSEKSQALSALGVSKSATIVDIRAAYKRRALEVHPDHGNGSDEEFSTVSQAYHFLKDNAEELGILDSPLRPRPVSRRPSVRPCETQFSDDILAECRACLDDETDTSSHVSTMLHRIGRQLTYFVPAAPSNGMNKVAVPTGEIVDSRRAVPQVVPVPTNEISGGVYNVPGEICDVLFPGARSVQIRFAA